ncbi:MAG: Nif3-like dinuclear metal center hexameric protein [Epsilonproteobacteria bacterium]|nr:Nif3-like dinuclear metal center hexameric protein [Campylobacterota bacterium]
MKISQMLEILNEIAPFETQESWDNSGLIIGSADFEFEKIYLSLDIDSRLIDNIEENSLLITHHPLIFKGLKEINYDKYPSNIVQKLISKNISLIAMHTNYDKAHLNQYVAEEILGYEVVEKDEFVCYFLVDDRFESFAKRVADSLKLPILKSVGKEKFIKKAAITTGSGGELIPYIKADCFLSGDIKYHQAYEAMENGLNLIEIGHFESEIFFAESLSKNLKKFDIQAIIANSKNPFTYKTLN